MSPIRTIGFAILLTNSFVSAERVNGTVKVFGGRDHNANVTLRRPLQPAPAYLTKTDAQGRFVFENVAPGEYQIVADAEVALPEARFILVEPGAEKVIQPITLFVCVICHEPQNVHFADDTTGLRYGPPFVRQVELEDASRTWLEGWIRGFEHPFQIAVTRHGDAFPLRTMTTGVENRFEFPDLPPGKYRLRAFTTNHAKNFADFIIEELEIKPGHITEIIDGLNMQPCLMGFKCKPVTMTWSEKF